MWFGTKSRIWPRPFARNAATMARKAALVAELGIQLVMVDDVVAVLLPGRAFR